MPPVSSRVDSGQSHSTTCRRCTSAVSSFPFYTWNRTPSVRLMIAFTTASKLHGNAHGGMLSAGYRAEAAWDYLFTHDGEPVRDFRCAWEALTKAAGAPGLLFHDFRRSAVRNMIRRGVPQKTARSISGHKPDSVFARYNIVSEADIQDAARRLRRARRPRFRAQFIVEPQKDSEREQEKLKSLPSDRLRNRAGVAELADAQDLGTRSRALQAKDLFGKHAT